MELITFRHCLGEWVNIFNVCFVIKMTAWHCGCAVFHTFSYVISASPLVVELDIK